MMQIDQDLTIGVALLTVLVWILPVVLDITFRVKRLRVLRLAIWTMAIAALLLFYLQPFYYTDPKPQDIALIDDHANSDSLKNLGFKIVTLEVFKQQSSAVNINHLALFQPLKRWQLEQLHADSISYHQEDIEGINNFIVSSPAYKGDVINFRFHSSYQEPYKGLLLQNGTLFDSVSVDTIGVYSLNFISKAVGNFTYQFLGVRQRDTIFHEMVPLRVFKKELPSILILNSNPNFESNYLKNHFSNLGYEISIRTQISKDRFNQEFVNRSKMDIRWITESVMGNTDLLILDTKAFLSLSLTERNRITNQIKIGKLGLLVLGNDVNELSKVLSVPANSFKDIEIQFPPVGKVEILTSNSIELTPLQYKNQVIGYKKKIGIGSMAIASISNMYQLYLNGYQPSYEAIVKMLTEPLLPKAGNKGFFVNQEIIRINEKCNIAFTSSAAEPKIFINEIRIPAIESPLQPNYFSISYWPSKLGWNTLSIPEDTVNHDFYVYPENAWQAAKSFKESEYTKHFVNNYRASGSRDLVKVKQHFSNWIYLTIFGLSMALLWIEQRFINP